MYTNTVAPIITSPTDCFTLTVNETEVALFQCTATGIPAPTISWYRNGMELSGDSRITLSNHTAPTLVQGDGGMVYSVSHTLMLADIVDDDSDTYTCVADNIVGNDSQEFEVDVQSELGQFQVFTVFYSSHFTVAPAIISAPANVTVVQPDSVTFTCVATGHSRPVITWFFEDSVGSRVVLVSGGDVFTNNALSGEREARSLLTIDFTAPMDAGVYVCVADNLVDTTEASAVLTVHG